MVKRDKFFDLTIISIFLFLLFIGSIVLSPSTLGAENFTDLTLADSLAIALENNRSLLATGQSLKSIESTVRIAESAKYPSLSISSNYLRLGGDMDQFDFELEASTMEDYFADIPEEWAEDLADFSNDIFSMLGEGFEQPDSVMQTELSLQQPLYTFGRISSGIAQAEAGYQAAEADYISNRQNLIHEVIINYNNVLLARELLNLQYDINEQLKGHLEVVEANLEAGMITELDRHEAKIALSEAEQEIIEARSNLNLAREGFRSLLGISRESDISLSKGEDQSFASLEKEVLSKAEDSELIDVADNPQLEALSYQQEVAESSLTMAEAERFPTITMMANYSWEDEGFGFSDSSWSLGVNVNFDIFTGGQRQAEIKQSEAEIKELEYNRQEAEDGLYIEANRALNALYDAKSQEELREEMILQAKKQLNLAELRYSEGVGTSTEVLDAHSGYSQARLTAKEARNSKVEALADLYLVLGEADKLVEEVQ